MTIIPGYPSVHFDFGALGALAGGLTARGIKRPLIITDTGLTEHGVVDIVRAALPGTPDIAVYDGIPPNPTVGGIEGALDVYRNQDCDGIIALGGGSVLDSGKALRVAAIHPEPIIEYLKDSSKITANVAPYYHYSNHRRDWGGDHLWWWYSSRTGEASARDSQPPCKTGPGNLRP